MIESLIATIIVVTPFSIIIIFLIMKGVDFIEKITLGDKEDE